MAMIYIDGILMPSPSYLKVSIDEIGSDSERNALGGRLVDHIATKRELEMEWSYLSAGDISLLMTAIENGKFVSLKYPDPMTNAERTMNCRAVSKSVALGKMDSGCEWFDMTAKFEEK